MGNDEEKRLCVTIYNPPCEISESTAETLNKIHVLAAQAISEKLAIDLDRIKVRSIHQCTKTSRYRHGLHSTLLVHCNWSDGLDNRSRDKQVQSVVFPIIGDHFGEEYDPQSKKALMYKGNEALWLIRDIAWLVLAGRIAA